MSVSSTTPPLAIQVSPGSHTDTGRRRSTNEDSHVAVFPVFVVADGMGGHEAGDRASAAVVAAFRPLLGRDDVSPEEVAQVVEHAHRTVAAIAATTTRGAGSTLTGVVCVRQGDIWRWLVLNVGDSRVYRLLSEHLEQLTTDHSVAQELVDQGALTREQMSTYEGRNVITRAIGEEHSRADYWLLPVVTGERLLICSDGLSGELTDEAIRAGLAMGGAAPRTAHALVAQALHNGGRDNITAIVLDVIGGGLGPRQGEPGLPPLDDVSATVESATIRSVRRSSRG